MKEKYFYTAKIARLFIAVICLICAGCQTPFTHSQLQFYASVEDDNAAKQLTVPAGKSVIYVLQEPAMDSGNFFTVVRLNYKEVRLLACGAYYMAVLEPGRHIIGIRSYDKFPNGPMYGRTDRYLGTELALNAEPNKVYFYATKIHYNLNLIGGGSFSSIEFNTEKEATARELLKTYRLSNSMPLPPN